MNLIQETANQVVDDEKSTTTILESVRIYKEKSALIQDLDVKVIVETAASALAMVSRQVNDPSTLNIDDAVDIVTMLKILSSSEYRAAVGDIISRNQFSMIVNSLKDDERVMKFLKRESNHPSFKAIKQSVKEMLTNIDTTEGKRTALSELQRLRMLYEKIQIRINRSTNSNKSDSPGDRTG